MSKAGKKRQDIRLEKDVQAKMQQLSPQGKIRVGQQLAIRILGRKMP